MPIDDKYMTNITVRNDSTMMVGGTKGFYRPNAEGDGEIRIVKGDISYKDFGFDNMTDQKLEELVLIHERQHEIDIEEKGVGKENISLNQYFQRDYHMEVGALIAEKLEIRRQFMEAKTDEEKRKFFEKFGNDVDNKDYVEALKSGKINPNSANPKDFMKEMAFIKNSSIEYRCDANDGGYKKAITNNAIAYLMTNGDNVRDNDSGFEKEVRAIYQIGGFDFTSVGNNDLYPMKDEGLEFADNLLESGADVNKVAKFMNEGKDGFAISNKAFIKAEELDLTGLSKEQAEIVLQTAIVAQEKAENIAESICFGDTSKMDMNSFLDGNEQVAMYIDIKRDIWAKNGTLSETGDEEKFNRLMEQAKTVELDTEGWLNGVQDILSIAKDPSKKEEYEALKRRVKENQGKVVNIDEFYNSVRLPMGAKSVENVLEDIRKKEEEDRKFWEEYYEKHPEEKNKKERVSEAYQKKIMNLQSSILADELKRKKEEENKVERLSNYSKIETYRPLGDDIVIKVETPKFDKAELRKITNKNGESVEVAMIDGQKHGAEITRDSDGDIVDFKLYDHGKEIDLKNRDVNIKTGTVNGMSYTAVELDGKDFGAKIETDENGRIKADFYNEGGVLMEGANISKNYIEGEFARQQLRDEIKEQRGEIIDSPMMHSQEKRFDMRYSKRVKTEKAENVETKPLEPAKESKFVPVWQKDGYDR